MAGLGIFVYSQPVMGYWVSMIITNKYGVPDVIWKAASSDKYSRGLSDISVTQLIDAPQIARLREKHHAEIEQDVADRMWSLLGTAVHSLLEHAEENCITEERLFTKSAGLVVSGAVDVQELLPDGSISIMDFKVTSVTSVMYGKKSWEDQLNCYAHLARESKAAHVSRLQICAILRDWKRADSRYPASPITIVDIPVWSKEKAANYFEQRATMHAEAIAGSIDPCSTEDRWERPTKYAVMKGANKRATRTFEQEEDAKEFADSVGGRVDVRPGEPVRCAQNYCQVAQFCPQYQARLEQEKAVANDRCGDTEEGWL
jgi:hypothetical protein